MKPQYNTEELIKMIKRACSVPTSQLTYTDADFAKLADDALKTQVVPLIMSAREEYFVEYLDVLSPADGVIEFPTNAIGEKLRTVAWVQQFNPLNMVNLPRFDLDVISGVGFSNPMTIAGFYIQGNSICLWPNTSVPTNTNIRLYYYRRSLVLTDPENYGQVISVDPLTGTIILSNVPTDWEVGTELNSVSSEPNFTITNEVAVVTNVSTPTVIVDDATGIEVGDYVTERGFSAIPQIPIEGMNWLATLTAVSCLSGLADIENASRVEKTAEVLKKNFLITVSQRVDGSVKKIMNPNGGLRWQAGIWRRGRGWY